MSAFFKVTASGPLFFISAWLLMLFAGAVHHDVGIAPFGYLTSMIVTIALWLTLAPAIGAAARPTSGRNSLLSQCVRARTSGHSALPSAMYVSAPRRPCRLG